MGVDTWGCDLSPNFGEWSGIYMYILQTFYRLKKYTENKQSYHVRSALTSSKYDTQEHKSGNNKKIIFIDKILPEQYIWMAPIIIDQIHQIDYIAPWIEVGDCFDAHATSAHRCQYR